MPRSDADQEQPGKEPCAHPGCTRTRVHGDCQRRTCRKHCLEAGGCSASGHAVPLGRAAAKTRSVPDPPRSSSHVSATQHSLPPTPSPVNPPLATITEERLPSDRPPSQARPASQALPLPPLPPPPPPPSSQPAAKKQRSQNAVAGPSQPRHVSHMKAIDLEALDKAIALETQNKAMEAEKKALQQQVENQVRVTVWKSVRSISAAT